jgi:polyferredoxin
MLGGDFILEVMMHQRYVQPLRIAIQWGFVLFCLFIGFRFYQFVSYFGSGATTLPFTRPAGVEAFLPISGLLGVKDWIVNGSINQIHPAAVVIFVTAIALSLLLKRAFCSWICPVGAISELLWKAGFRATRRNFRLPTWLDIPLRGLKYLLLTFFLVSILWKMPAAAVADFIASDYHKVADVRLLDFFLRMSGLPLIVITILALLSIPFKNAFCRYLCPYGALLGLTSMLSPLKVTRSKAACISCGVCSQFCPSYLPVMTKERIHSPECIGCWRCISNCRAAGALEMKLPGNRTAIVGVLFAGLVVGLFWGGSLIGKATGHWHNSITAAEYGRLLKR